MKRKDIFALQKGFEQTKDYNGLKFAYARIKNKKKIEEEIEALKEAFGISKEAEEFQMKRMELLRKYAKLDESGKFVVGDNGNAVFEEGNQAKFEEEFAVLRTDYEEALSKETEKEKEYNKVLEEDIELDLMKITIDDFPTTITGEQLELLSPMIKED